MSKDTRHYWPGTRLGEEFHDSRKDMPHGGKVLVSQELGETFSYRYSTEVLGYVPLLHPDSKGIAQGHDGVYFDPENNRVVVVEAKGQWARESAAQEKQDWAVRVSERIEDAVRVYQRASHEEKDMAHVLLRANAEEGIKVVYQVQRTFVKEDGRCYTEIEREREVYTKYSDIESVRERISGEAEAVPGTLVTRPLEAPGPSEGTGQTLSLPLEAEEAHDKKEQVVPAGELVAELQGVSEPAPEAREKISDDILVHSPESSGTSDLPPIEPFTIGAPPEPEPVVTVEGIPVDDTAPIQPVADEPFDSRGEVVDVEVIPFEPGVPLAEIPVITDSPDVEDHIIDITPIDIIPAEPVAEVVLAEPSTLGPMTTNNSPVEPIAGIVAAETETVSGGSEQAAESAWPAQLEITTTAEQTALSVAGGVSDTMPSALEQHTSAFEATGGYGTEFGEAGWDKSGGSFH